MSIADMRLEYNKHGLSEAEALGDPFAQFHVWFQQAVDAQVNEPNAMNLATLNDRGYPSSRIVLLKGFDWRGLQFFTNYESAKGRDLARCPGAALCFFWPELERQIRIEGEVIRVTPQESDAYHDSRPRGSQLGAWTSEQSTVVASREELEQLNQAVRERFGDGPVPRPPHWGGFRLVPTMFEFWQGRPSRLHDRLRYTLGAQGWIRERLSP